jgi:hypothetical protein
MDGALNEHLRAVDTLDAIYSRVISVLQCSISEQGCPNHAEIQADFEETAVLSWPLLIPRDFINLLEIDEEAVPTWRLSLVILAYYYVVNTLLDRWYLNGSFEGEIFKIHEIVRTSGSSQLTGLMIWPVRVASS